MQTALDGLENGARLGIVRLRSLGDCILTTPALAILRRARPDLRVALVAEKRFWPLFAGNPDVDELLPPSPWKLLAWRPRLCLNLHGGTRSAVLTACSGARWRAGFAHFRWPWLYHLRIPRAQEVLQVSRRVHTAEHLASAMFYLGAPAGEIPRARLPLGAPPEEAPYAVLHPVASEPGKRWPSAGFLAVARHLRDDWNTEPVFIAGPGENLDEFAGWRRLQGEPLPKIMSLISGARVFVGNDSGPAHMAAAYGVPVVVLFGTSDPVVWAPWKTPAEVLVTAAGIESLGADQVIQSLERLLTTS